MWTAIPVSGNCIWASGSVTSHNTPPLTAPWTSSGKVNHLYQHYGDGDACIIPTDGSTSPPSSGYSLESSKIDLWEIVVACVLSFLVMAFLVTILILNFIWRNKKYSLIIPYACMILYRISLNDSYIFMLIKINVVFFSSGISKLEVHV